MTGKMLVRGREAEFGVVNGNEDRSRYIGRRGDRFVQQRMTIMSGQGNIDFLRATRESPNQAESARMPVQTGTINCSLKMCR